MGEFETAVVLRVISKARMTVLLYKPQSDLQPLQSRRLEPWGWMSQRLNRLAGFEAKEGVTGCDAECGSGVSIYLYEKKENNRRKTDCTRDIAEGRPTGREQESQRYVRRHHGRNGYGCHGRRREGGVVLPKCGHLPGSGGARHVGMGRAE